MIHEVVVVGEIGRERKGDVDHRVCKDREGGGGVVREACLVAGENGGRGGKVRLTRRNMGWMVVR